MANFNKVILVGNLTRDVEVKFLQSGMAVADIGMAVNEYRKGKDGEKTEYTSFFEVTAFGSQAETVAKYLSKGKSMLVEGKLKQDRWEDQDGGKRSAVKVIADRIQFLSPVDSDNANTSYSDDEETGPSNGTSTTDADIPF